MASQRSAQTSTNTYITAPGPRQGQAVPGQGHDHVAFLSSPVHHHLIVGIIQTNLKEIKPTQELGPTMSEGHDILKQDSLSSFVTQKQLRF